MTITVDVTHQMGDDLLMKSTTREEAVMAAVQLDTQEQAFVQAIAGGATTLAKVKTATGVDAKQLTNVVRRLVRKGVVLKDGQVLAVANVAAEAAPAEADLGQSPELSASEQETAGSTQESKGSDAAKAAAAARAQERTEEQGAVARDKERKEQERKDAKAAQGARDKMLGELYATTTDAIDVIVEKVAEETKTAPLSIARARQILARDSVQREAGRAGKGSTAERDAAIVEAIKAGGDIREVAEANGLSVPRTRQIIYAAGVKTSKATTELTATQEREIVTAVKAILAAHDITLNRLVSVVRKESQDA